MYNLVWPKVPITFTLGEIQQNFPLWDRPLNLSSILSFVEQLFGLIFEWTSLEFGNLILEPNNWFDLYKRIFRDSLKVFQLLLLKLYKEK